MKKGKDEQLEPMLRTVQVGIVVFSAIFVVLVFFGGKYFLANWKGNAIFLPFALLIGLLLVAAIVVQMFRNR